MANISSMFAHNYFVTGSYTLTVIEDVAHHGYTETYSSGGYYRFFLVNSASQVGTEQGPWDFYQKTVDFTTTGHWNFSLDVNGYVNIQYTGPTFTGSLSWSSPIPALALGFTSSFLSFPSGANQTQRANYQPYGALFTINKTNDNDWQPEPSLGVSVDMPDGTVYGFDDGLLKHTRQFDLKYNPRDFTYAGNGATPVFPTNHGIWTQVPTLEGGFSLPYTFLDFRMGARYRRMGAIFGTFVSSSQNVSCSYDEVYLSSKFLNAPMSLKPSIANFIKLRDSTAIILNFVSASSRFP